MSAKDFDPVEFLQALFDIARSNTRVHIVSEFQRCASSSDGSEEHTLFPRPIRQSSPTETSTSGTGPEQSEPSTERTWWHHQDRDEAWNQHWSEEDLDPIDPQSWK